MAQIFNGEIAASKGNPNWDVRADGEGISVKAHAKAADNSTRWTGFPEQPAGVDAIAVVAFSPASRVLELYKVPLEELRRLLRPIRVQAPTSLGLTWGIGGSARRRYQRRARCGRCLSDGGVQATRLRTGCIRRSASRPTAEPER